MMRGEDAEWDEDGEREGMAREVPRPVGRRALVLEAMLPMPTKKRRMRTQCDPLRHDRPAGLVDDRFDAWPVVHLPGNQDFEIVRQAD